MTVSDVRTDAVADRLWMWFGQPAGQPATLLMVHARNDEVGTYLAPLIAGSLEQANRQAVIAEDAADALGVTATLREYELIAVSDLVPAGETP
jgi:hypothetical protein